MVRHMKRFVSILLILMMLAAVFSGCGGKSPAAQDAKAQAAGDTEKAVGNAFEIMETLTNGEWPADKLPDGLPEYTGGEIVNSGGDNEAFYVKIDKTTKEDLAAYLEKLKASGWAVTAGNRPEAEKGIYSINFDWQGAAHLQMALRTTEISGWPAGQVPPDVIPPENVVFIGGIEVLEAVPGSVWYFNYKCQGIDEAAAEAYMEMLMENGWEGDRSQVAKSFEWKGEQYRATVEIYETVGDTTTFTCNYYFPD